MRFNNIATSIQPSQHLRSNCNDLPRCHQNCKTARRIRKYVNIRCPFHHRVQAMSSNTSPVVPFEEVYMHDIGARFGLFLCLGDKGFRPQRPELIQVHWPYARIRLSSYAPPLRPPMLYIEARPLAMQSVVGRSDIPEQLYSSSTRALKSPKFCYLRSCR